MPPANGESATDARGRSLLIMPVVRAYGPAGSRMPALAGVVPGFGQKSMLGNFGESAYSVRRSLKLRRLS